LPLQNRELNIQVKHYLETVALHASRSAGSHWKKKKNIRQLGCVEGHHEKQRMCLHKKAITSSLQRNHSALVERAHWKIRQMQHRRGPTVKPNTKHSPRTRGHLGWIRYMCSWHA
jgi:hypothetical protein